MEKVKCKNCKKAWIPRTEKPVKCPRCFKPLEEPKRVLAG